MHLASTDKGSWLQLKTSFETILKTLIFTKKKFSGWNGPILYIFSLTKIVVKVSEHVEKVPELFHTAEGKCDLVLSTGLGVHLRMRG